jgi:tetratricopeptide (TPR) repeat protein
MKRPPAILLLALLLAAAFTLATTLQWHRLHWTHRVESEGVLKLLLGDSRRLFANHFYVKADVYFHSGFYPSIFDQARQVEERENHMAAEQSGTGHDDHDHEQETALPAGEPDDWIVRFGRHFRITEHKHLHGGDLKEILPWLRIAAELDPHRIDTYTVAAYFLIRHLGKVDEAEQFLRDGLEANPDSYELAFELGQLYLVQRNDPVRARNLWLLALRRWRETEGTQKEPNYVPFDKITVNLGELEAKSGNIPKAIEWLELAKTHSANVESLQKQIDALRAQIGEGAK